MPWIGVMAAGYAFGRALQMPVERRNRACLMIGGAAMALFVVLRTFNIYGDPRPWNGGQPLSFLNATKAARRWWAQRTKAASGRLAKPIGAA